jgi:hypothetical protein
MKDFPDKITKLSKTVIEKLTALRSPTYSTWKLVDWKKAEEKLNEEGRDKREINEAVKKSLPWSVYWFKYQDGDGEDRELKVVERYGEGKVHRITPPQNKGRGGSLDIPAYGTKRA